MKINYTDDEILKLTLIAALTADIWAIICV